MRCIIAIAMLIFCTTADLYADTIVMKDKTKIKGLVVDEYTDRITLNSIDGERDLFRRDIERIEYDSPEQNFMQLGRAYEDKGWYEKATSYYKKAMDVNPDYHEARDAYIASYTKMLRQKDEITRKELKRRSMVMEWRKNKDRDAAVLPRDEAAPLKNSLGISLITKDGFFIIDYVRPASRAENAGISKGDVLVAIWGKLIRYSKVKDVVDSLLGPRYSEVKVTIEKKISIPIGIKNKSKNLYRELGISLNFEYEGLTVTGFEAGKTAGRTGLKKGDIVIAIDNNSTRYLPISTVIALINSSKDNKEMVFVVRRNITLRREGR